MQELLSGIESREKLLLAKSKQLEVQNEKVSNSLEGRLDRLKGEEVRVASRMTELN